MHRNPVVRGLVASLEDWRWEQLPLLCIWRGGIGSDQRLEVVGRQNSAKRWL